MMLTEPGLAWGELFAILMVSALASFGAVALAVLFWIGVTNLVTLG